MTRARPSLDINRHQLFQDPDMGTDEYWQYTQTGLPATYFPIRKE